MVGMSEVWVVEVRLLRLLAQVRDQVVPVLRLLQTAESHLRAGDVLLWVLEVLELSDVSAIAPI